MIRKVATLPGGNVSVYQPGDMAELQRTMLALEGRLVDPATNHMRLLHRREYNAMDWTHLRLWMHFRAVYTLPTVELVAWLREMIGGRKAIEVGAGNNDLCYHLGIPGTDSYIQTTPQMRALYAAQHQYPTNPPANVLRMSAAEAIESLRPQVVIASWLTRLHQPGEAAPGTVQASTWGTLEEELIRRVETYIHIGNTASHGTKTALAVPHQTHHHSGLITRGSPDLDVIYQWGK